MTKRIAMISVHECPLASSEGKERGGINVYVFELAKALSRIGWQVDMFTRMQDTVNPSVVQVNEKTRVIHIPAGPKTAIPKDDVLQHLPEFTHNMQNFMREEQKQYNLIHAHYYYSGAVAEAVRNTQVYPLPVIMTFHTLGLLKQLTQPQTRSGGLSERIAIEKRLVVSADRIIATSDSEVAYLSALYDAPASHIRAIPPGVDTSLFRNIPKSEAKKTIGEDPNHRIILSVGRIDPVKGFDVLLYALKLLVRSNPEAAHHACLWIVGGDVEEKRRAWNSEQTKLETLRKTLGLDTTVKFIPAQSQEQLPAYYNAAEVLVMPSHYESFGMVALEALACGTPVIATDVTGISPLVRAVPKGHIISANNPILLSQKLAHVLLHTPATGTDTSKMIASLDWKETAEKITAAYAL